LISKNTDGQYIDGNNTKEVEDFVSKTLKSLEKKEFEAKKFISYKDQFQIFIFISFLLLLFELFIFEKETVWLKKLNLFNEKKSL
jgi:Ca-activated chloride channel family protein